MKTKSILIGLCLLMGISMVQVSAQDGETRAVQYWTEGAAYTPVFCDDVWVDRVDATVLIHVVNHFKDGVWQWQIIQIKGEGVGLLSGENFKYKEIDKYMTDTRLLIWHYNLIGDMGSHYIGTLSYNYATKEFIIGKTVCN